MQIHRAAAGLTIALAATAALPAVATAAPISLPHAVLAAHEFPSGSTNYKVEQETVSPGRIPAHLQGTACGAKWTSLIEAAAGGQSVEAEVKRGSTELEASILSRPTTTIARDMMLTCDRQIASNDRLSVRPVPADLAALKPFVISFSKSDLQAWVDVRGVTVLVEAEADNNATVDADGFWQTLRAQISKVQRQR